MDLLVQLIEPNEVLVVELYYYGDGHILCLAVCIKYFKIFNKRAKNFISRKW